MKKTMITWSHFTKRLSVMLYPLRVKSKSKVAPNRSKFGRKISVIKSICGAISAFVPPLRIKLTGSLQKRATGKDTCSNKATLLKYNEKN